VERAEIKHYSVKQPQIEVEETIEVKVTVAVETDSQASAIIYANMDIERQIISN